MERLPGEEEAGEWLRETCLRDFRPASDDLEDEGTATDSWQLAIPPQLAPVPYLLRYALGLIGLEARGPGEKVAWWVNFTYKGESCQLAFEKFGLRLYLRTASAKTAAGARLEEIAKKLQASMRTIEKVIAHHRFTLYSPRNR